MLLSLTTMGPVLFDKNDNKLIEFGDTTEFIVGRSIDHHLCIPDSTISRKQCIIKKVPEGEWLVKDTSSFQTTLVNGVNVPTSGLYIKCGDIITFGTLRSWQLEFYLSVEDMPPTLKRRRTVVDNDVEPSSQESRSSRQTERSECSQPKKSKTQKEVNFREKYEAVLSEKAQLAGSVEELKEKVKELEEAKDRADDILVSSHLDRKHLQTDYEDCCTEVDRLVKERQALLEELRENIQKREAAEALANACGSSSQASSSEIESSLILKTVEVSELKDELEEAKAKLAKAEETAQSLTVMKEKVYNDAVAIIEQEFLCCVCTDLMFEPVTLNCRHTMCAKCLDEWKKKQKKCPSCRTTIKTEVRPLMIDSFIDRIAPLLGEEFTKKRQEAKTEKWARPANPPPGEAPVPPTRGRRNSRRGGGRGGRGGQGTYGGYGYVSNIPMPPLHPIPPQPPNQVIDLTNHTSPRSRSTRADVYAARMLVDLLRNQFL
uniref:E3 ubiquitin-protein ligase CHFR n=2 Tax=Lygus hesperus TaxID=30085 RepID=A0A146M9N2_LYGHE